jgi:hypothetical protein
VRNQRFLNRPELGEIVIDGDLRRREDVVPIIPLFLSQVRKARVGQAKVIKYFKG